MRRYSVIAMLLGVIVAVIFAASFSQAEEGPGIIRDDASTGRQVARFSISPTPLVFREPKERSEELEVYFTLGSSGGKIGFMVAEKEAESLSLTRGNSSKSTSRKKKWWEDWGRLTDRLSLLKEGSRFLGNNIAVKGNLKTAKVVWENPKNKDKSVILEFKFKGENEGTKLGYQFEF